MLADRANATTGTYFVDEVLGDDLSESCVQLLAVFVKHHGVGVPVKLLEAQAAVVLPLDLLDGVLQEVPDVVHILFVHCHLNTHEINTRFFIFPFLFIYCNWLFNKKENCANVYSDG